MSSLCCDVVHELSSVWRLCIFILLGDVVMLVYSYVAGEGVELTVHKESVVVEKLKEVELRSRRAQLYMTEIIIELGHSHTPSRLPVKKLRRLLHKRRKVREFVWKGIWKNIISYYSPAFTINPQPRRLSVRSHSVLLELVVRKVLTHPLILYLKIL